MKMKREFVFSFIFLFGKGLCDGNFEGQNVALVKPRYTEQGPETLHGLKANLAVDGNESPSADSGLCAHTTEGNDTYKAWWQLTLEQPYWISGIKIVNRERKHINLRDRLSGMLVKGTVRHLIGTWAPETTLFEDKHVVSTCSNSNLKRGADVCADVIEIEINPAILLSRIIITTPNFLTLCEVEVFEVACRVPDAPEHGMYLSPNITNGTVPYGMYIYLHCDEGSESSDQGESLQCGANGLFGFIPQLCEAVMCNSPPDSFLNGSYNPPNMIGPFHYNFTFFPVCERGFTLAGEPNRTCISSNIWSGSKPSCTQVTCQVPSFSNGYYLSENKPVPVNTSFSFGTMIQPNCKTGYSLSKSEQQTCQEDGKFIGENSICTIVTCSSFGKLENGTLHYNDGHNMTQLADGGKNYTYGVKVRASCDSGFQLVRGSNGQICSENGTWAGVNPVCSKIKCNDTSILSLQFQQSPKLYTFLERGNASYNSSIFYLMTGNLSFICLANGSLSWESQPPEIASVCKLQHKENLIVNTSGCLQTDTCESGTRVSYDCVGDYEVSVRNSTCQADHTWSAEPICTYHAQSTKTSAATVGASVGGTALVIAVVTVILVIYRQRRKAAKLSRERRYEKPIENDGKPSNNYSELNELQIAVPKGKDEYAYSTDTYEEEPTTEQSYYSFETRKKIPETAISVDDLYEVVLSPGYVDTMKNQFEAFPKGLTEDYTEALKIKNRSKNRYKKIYPYDDTRVILPLDDQYNSDYINASYIHGYTRTRAFIASQGPTDEILVDFWRMVWETKSGKIVMLTNLTEDQKMKCIQYWPDEGSVKYDDYKVTIRGKEYFSDFVIRKLAIKKAEAEERKIYQFHFTSWPDKSVPKYASSLVHFRHKVDTTTVKWKGPVIVHCSAGIGRTGTFISLSFLAEQASVMGYVDPVGCVNTLRRQRVDMVQTPDQYIFLHMALLETLMLSTSALPASKFLGAYEELLSFDEDRQKIDLEFSRMKTMSPVVDECQYVSAKEVRNRNKNRYSNILPDADHMPYLTPSGKKSEPDYINAVFLPGYKKKGAFIVTQTPLEATKTDFWRLVVEHDVRTIVMMNNRSEMKEGEIYWPENEDPEAFENITIFKTDEECERGLRKISLDLKRFGKTQKLQQIQLESWPAGSTLPSSPKDVLNLLDAVQYWQHQSGNNPVLVHCMNGADRSGLLCVVSAVLERMKIEQDVAITHVIKEMRNYREQVIPTLEQFQFVHEVIKEYILQNETYSNFTD